MRAVQEAGDNDEVTFLHILSEAWMSVSRTITVSQTISNQNPSRLRRGIPQSGRRAIEPERPRRGLGGFKPRPGLGPDHRNLEERHRGGQEGNGDGCFAEGGIEGQGPAR